ncbi:uncharacterized protein LOC111086547 [Limulus polyphemus]|uniref:Uncharacterized protein LOC111086547 n=1 Tax=Limulus polyphemus TaxID=6850 RepID=A0ABM1SPB2_LIMPO|nr:uncharacterized protein LOC111086547 [Limulus polyphemus]
MKIVYSLLVLFFFQWEYSSSEGFFIKVSKSVHGLGLLRHAAYYRTYYFSYGFYPIYRNGYYYRHHHVWRRSTEEEVKSGQEVLSIQEIFRDISSNDEYQCLIRMMCEMGINPYTYGQFGVDMSSLLRNVYDPDPNYQKYQNSFLLGDRSKSTAICTDNFPTCTATSEELRMYATTD